MDLALEEKIEYCMKLQSGEMNILAGVYVHIYDSNAEAQTLCDIMEATTTSNIIPFLTTVIVVDKITPVYKNIINQLYSRAVEGHKQGEIHSRGTITSMINFQTVSIEWLRQCLLQEKKVDCESYKP